MRRGSVGIGAGTAAADQVGALPRLFRLVKERKTDSKRRRERQGQLGLFTPLNSQRW